jgi:hypothetical protein
VHIAKTSGEVCGLVDSPAIARGPAHLLKENNVGLLFAKEPGNTLDAAIALEDVVRHDP